MTGHAHPTHEPPYLPAMGRRWLLPLYDPFTRLFGVGRLHEQLLDRAEIQPGQAILEIGCGTGNLLLALARRRLDLSLIGIDPDPDALRRARRKAGRARLPVRFERGYAGALPLPDASVDRVLSSLMLHHLDEEEKTRAMAEIRRVLRPGGQLHIVDLAGSPDDRGLHARLARRNPRRAGDLPDQLLSRLRDAGLTDVGENGRGDSHFGGYVFYRAQC